MQQSKYLIENFHALGTIWFIEIFEYNKNTSNLSDKIKSMLINFDNNYSRFKVTSYISQLNLNRKIKIPTQEFFELINFGIKYFQDTEGLINFGMGENLTNLGYGNINVFDKKVSPKNKSKNSKVLDLIQINEDEITLNGYIALDLGAFGKGYLIDKIAKFLQENGVHYFLINGGGDIYATSSNGIPISIYLQDPYNLDKYVNKINILNSAICGSSKLKRTWRDKQNKVVSHIQNPFEIFNKRNKNLNIVPKDFSFIASKDCVTADMLATLFCINSQAAFIKRMKEKYEFEIIDLKLTNK